MEVVAKKTSTKNNPYYDIDFQKTGQGENAKVDRNSMGNVVKILTTIFPNRIKLNLVTNCQELTQDSTLLDTKAGEIDDNVINSLKGWIDNVWHVTFTDQLINSAVTYVANRNAYNPLIDELEACEQEYLETVDPDNGYRGDDETILLGIVDGFRWTIIQKALGVDAGEYNDVCRWITNTWFLGAVNQAYNHGAKNDYCLDLVGGQGIGKTVFLQRISLGYYTDQFSDFSDKDNLDRMLASWIVNDDEMTATKNASFAELKKFVSTTTFSYRKSYGRRSGKHLRGFALARTTNELTYLKDASGERRFLPLRCNVEKQTLKPYRDDELTDKLIRLAIGEAVHQYKQGGWTLETPDDIRDELEEYRTKFKYADAINAEIEIQVEKMMKNPNRQYIRNEELLESMTGTTNVAAAGNKKLLNKIKVYLENNGFEYARRRVGGDRLRAWFPID